MRFATLLPLAGVFFSLASLASLQGCFSEPTTTPLAGPVGPDGAVITGSGPATCVVKGQTPPVAPGGYYTNGAAVCAADGTLHMFHGVDRPSLEFCASTNVGCTHISSNDFALMAGWNANVVRVALDQDRWLANAALYDPSYASSIDSIIQYSEAVGMDVILDLHWSDRGDLTVTAQAKQAAGNSNQQPMADLNSLEFWKEVAARYRGDGHVLFELYNEPNNVPWSVWLNGGSVGGYTYVGMQQLYNAIRNDSHADNVVIAGGLQYAFDLSSVGASPIQGYNLMYASHPYKSGDPQSLWDSHFGYLAKNNVAPVILTEFGDNQNTPNCTGAWDQAVIDYSNKYGISWTAWAWYVPGDGSLQSLCSFPSLIADWFGTPSVQGVVVKAELAKYPLVQPPPPQGADAGAGDADAGDATVGDADATVDDATLADVTAADAATPEAGADEASAGEASADDDASDGGSAADVGDDGSDAASSEAGDD
jgi:endoglucanase